MPTDLRVHPVVDAATRREFLTLLGGAGLLAGCGRGEQDAGPAASAQTKSFEHALGTTVVPVSPQRVVSLGSTFTTWQLATLGVYSIATSSASTEDPTEYIRLADPDAAAALDGIVSVDGGGGLNVEQLAALEPDLIVGGDYAADLYEELSAIAPTVLLASDLPNDRFYGVQGALAELTGTTAVLERLHEEYDARVADLRERHAERWSALEWLVLDEIAGEGIIGLTNLTDRGPAYRVLSDLGAPLAGSSEQFADAESVRRSGFIEISSELVAGLRADVLFIAPPYTKLITDPDTPISPDLRGLLGSTTAARADQILPVGLAWTSTNVASLMLVLDDLEAFLADRPEGFFATGDA